MSPNTDQKKLRIWTLFMQCIKLIFISTFSIYTVQKPFQKLLVILLVPCSERLLISSATLSCKACNDSTFSM